MYINFNTLMAINVYVQAVYILILTHITAIYYHYTVYQMMIQETSI